MLNLFTIPAATTTIAQVGEYSSPWFEALLPVMYVAVGIVVAVLLVIWLKEKLLNGIAYLFTGGGSTNSFGGEEPADINVHYRNPPYRH